MRWQVAYATAVSVGVFWTTPTDAFTVVVPTHHHPHTLLRDGSGSMTRLRVGGGTGWDNENFLDALSGGSQDREEANDDYYKKSRFGRPEEGEDLSEEGTTGAQLTPEMIEKVKASHTEEEEASQGGKMFQQLMARAEQGGGARPPPSMAATPPQQAAVPPQQQQQQQPQQPTAVPNLDGLSVEQQAAIFRQMMQQQQQPQQQPPPQQQQQGAGFPQAYPPQGVPLAPDGRKVGRNKDADAIVNTSDVYIAQLKRDSSTRNTARYSGDDEYANQVFADPSLKDIKLHVNPYLEEARKKEQEMIETVPEEMVDPSMFVDEDSEEDKKSSGISYKERLAQRRNRNKNQGGSAPVAATAAAAPAAPPAPATTEIPPTTEKPATPEPVVAQTPPAPAAPVTAPAPPPAAPAPVRTAAAAPAPAPAPAPAAPSGTSSSGDARQDVRTLMGLLLKHRGGPGFGSGRLKGAEMDRFDNLSADMLRLLRQEAMETVSDGGDSTTTSAIAQDLQVGRRKTAVTTETSTTTRTTTTSAAASTTTSSTDDAARADSMVACIEGAVQMYKNSPPELRETSMMTLRAALLSAVTTCNELIAKNEVQNVQAYQAATGAGPAAPAMPKEFYNVEPQQSVVVEEQEEEKVVPPAPTAAAASPAAPKAPAVEPKATATPKPKDPVAPAAAAEPPAAAAPATPAVTEHSGNDANSQLFQSIYDNLASSAGDGKMGLRKDLSPKEAKELMNDLTDMRMLLLDELDTGIPAAAAANDEPQDDDDDDSKDSSSASKYQQLLAKARANKEQS